MTVTLITTTLITYYTNYHDTIYRDTNYRDTIYRDTIDLSPGSSFLITVKKKRKLHGMIESTLSEH